jgi:hypothetical protein
MSIGKGEDSDIHAAHPDVQAPCEETCVYHLEDNLVDSCISYLSRKM